MFVYQKAQRLAEKGFTSFVLRGDGPRMELGGFPVDSIALTSRSAQFDLTVQVAEDGGRLAVSAEYNTDLFDAATIDRLLGHYRTLLDAVADDPERSVADLPLLTLPERQQLALWNATETQSPDESSVVSLFERRATECPDAPALVAADGTLTYRELNARANRLAHRLRALGVGPEVRVAVCAERETGAVAGILAVLKAGGAYVPLDPDYPVDRLAFMIADSRAPVLLVSDRLRSRVAPEGTRILSLDDHDGVPDTDPAPRPALDDLAYVIYTSGSTGTPKGVLITHRNLVESTRARFLYYGEPVVAYLMVSSFAFDSSVAGLFWTLAQGGTLVLPAPGEHADPMALARLIRRQGVTHFLSVPSLYSLLLEHAEAADLSSLRTSIVAGEPCPRDLPGRHERFIPWANLYNEYGPTEATVWATVHRCDRSDAARGSIPIGRPIANTRAYLLDARGNPIPVGVIGELYLGGAGVARGYQGRPDLTAERFVPDPFSVEPGGRLYRTGDLARYRPDGVIECLGRLDGQVKIRGYRIELGEVESALRTQPDVREAAAVARQEPTGEWKLAAYLVARPGATLTVSALREWMSARLPDAMVPTIFAVLDALPLLPNGKVDRSALPDPTHARLSAASREPEAPRNPVEAELSRIASGLLNVDHVGIHDNVFELGLDSIVAIQLVARARRAGIGLTPANVFQSPTVAAMAALAAAAPALEAEQGIVTGPVPLTPIQRWFFDQDLAAADHFNYSVMLEVDPLPDQGSLERALAAIAVHHDALRLRFTRTDEGWLQVNSTDATIPVDRFELSNLSESELASALERATARVHAGLDLESGPLVRAALIDLGPSRGGRLLLVAHHLVMDGVSLRTVVEDLASLLGHHETPSLPRKTTSFRHWALGLAAYASSDELTGESGYWLERARIESATLPRDMGPSGDPGFERDAARVVETLGTSETRALLHDVPQTLNATVQEALLASVAQTLAAWSTGRALRIDVEGHGREDVVDGADLSRTVGWFTTVSPVVLEPGSGGDPIEAAAEA